MERSEVENLVGHRKVFVEGGDAKESEIRLAVFYGLRNR